MNHEHRRRRARSARPQEARHPRPDPPRSRRPGPGARRRPRDRRGHRGRRRGLCAHVLQLLRDRRRTPSSGPTPRPSSASPPRWWPARPASSALTAVRNAFVDHLAALEADEELWRMRRRLAAREPALAARLAGANDRLESAVVDAAYRRSGTDPARDLRPALGARVAMAAVRTAVGAHVASGFRGVPARPARRGVRGHRLRLSASAAGSVTASVACRETGAPADAAVTASDVASGRAMPSRRAKTNRC